MTLVAHREEPIPSLQKARPELPEAVDAIFRRMVAKRPEERYPNVTELLRDLDTLASSLAGVVPGAPAGSDRRDARSPDATVASVLAESIDFARDHKSGPPVPAGRPRWAWVGGAALACVLAVLAGLFLRGVPSKVRTPPEAVVRVPPANTGSAAAPWTASSEGGRPRRP